MYKRFLIALILSLVFLGINESSFSMMCGEKIHLAQHQHTEETAEIEKAVGVGNKICPVSGEKIDEKTKVTYEYKGKIYNFCCPMCIDEFKKDPEKYIKKLEEELQVESKEGVNTEENRC